MTKRMLIDATHAEETRVVVLDGNRLEDFDVETSTKRQLKGNIYLAKVVRVEPSLQAAFVEYGGNRHGFLAFGEIHPDYYQIPVADRQRLLDMQAEEARAGGRGGGPGRRAAEPGAPPAAAQPTAPTPPTRGRGSRRRDPARPRPRRLRPRPAPSAGPLEPDPADPDRSREPPSRQRAASPTIAGRSRTDEPRRRRADRGRHARPAADDRRAVASDIRGRMPDGRATELAAEAAERCRRSRRRADDGGHRRAHAEPAADLPPPETVGGDGDARRRPARAPHPAALPAQLQDPGGHPAAGRSCWCRWSRRSAAPRARR